MAVFALVLFLFVLYPMGQLAWRSLLDNQGRFVGAANYARYFGTPAIASSITNSLHVSAGLHGRHGAPGLRLCLWAHADRCMPWQGLFRLVAMLPLFAPSLVQALAFIHVFGNNGILTRTTGLNIGIYGAKGIIFAEVFYCFPHALLILIAALSATDARLYDAARTLGASPLKTFLTVTLPGVKFGLVSACFVVFTLVITDFGAPKAIGGKFSVMATEIYNQVSGQQNFTMGATVSVVLLIPAVLAFVVDRIVQRRQYALVTSSSQAARAAAPAARRLGGLRLLRAHRGRDRGALSHHPRLLPGRPLALQLHAHPQALCLRHGGRVRADPGTACTSRRGRPSSAPRSTFVGAYVVEKCRTAASGPLYLLSILPVSIPGMVLGLAYIFTFNAPGSVLNLLYGTLAILVVSNVIHYFTVGLPDRDHRAQADGRGVRERVGVPRRAVLHDVLARDRADGAARRSSASACTSS